MTEPKSPFSHLPMSREEARGRGDFDVILVSGDAYVDHPAFGIPLLARHLEAHGFKVGIIAQPDWRTKDAFMALGKPRLFFGVGAGAMDSMVAHYTPARKLRHDDAYTPGGKHGARPNRATLVYTSRLKEAYPGTPVILGGIEASLRRLAHYDFWEDKVRRAILFDAKADFLIYGMAEAPLLEVAKRMDRGESLSQIHNVRGTCYILKDKPGPSHGEPSQEGGEMDGAPAKGSSSEDGIWLPSFEEVSVDKTKYTESVRLAFHEHNPHRARPLWQMHGTRVLVVQPPALPLSEGEMDALYDLPFTRLPHPRYQGVLTAFEQIKDSITTHRGCFGGCAFCAITSHQGKTIQSRSRESVLREIRSLSKKSFFRGSLSDVGGPTANMYGLRCGDERAETMCLRESCLFPTTCKNLVTSDDGAVALLREVRSVPGVKHVAVSSGVRYDLMDAQPDYFEELAEHHVGGLLKVAPEHLVDRITDVMRKPGRKHFDKFLTWYREKNQEVGKRHSVVPYLISGHPGCTLEDMVELAFALKKLGLKVEQVQDFTPTPGTLATAMFHTGIDPITGKKVYVARTDREKAMQKALLLWHLPEYHPKIKDAFREIGRGDVWRLIGA